MVSFKTVHLQEISKYDCYYCQNTILFSMFCYFKLILVTLEYWVTHPMKHIRFKPLLKVKIRVIFYIICFNILLNQTITIVSKLFHSLSFIAFFMLYKANNNYDNFSSAFSNNILPLETYFGLQNTLVTDAEQR